MEPNSPVLAKRLWHMVRIAFFMLRKGISKRKLMVDLHLMLKRGKIAGKAIGNLVFHHRRSSDAHLFSVGRREYEFSCSNSPAYAAYFPFNVTKRKNHHASTHSHHNHYFSCARPTTTDDDITAANAVQKVLEMLNSDVLTEASPIIHLPGFGRSPMVRQLRITDSPFPVRDTDEDNHVDKEAEEFIERFYKDLKLQKTMSAGMETPYHDAWDR